MSAKEMLKEPDWALKIVKAMNGFILEHYGELYTGPGEPARVREYKYVYEEKDTLDDDGERQAAVDMLYAVLEHFNVQGIRIEKVPADE